MKRTAEQTEQAREIVSQYLQECANNAHEAYNAYIKYYLISGRPLPECITGIRDFINWSKPEQQKSALTKRYTKKTITTSDYKMNVDDIVSYCKHMVVLTEEQLKIDKKSKLFKDNAITTWSNLQQYKILLCKITGIEYICTDLIP